MFNDKILSENDNVLLKVKTHSFTISINKRHSFAFDRLGRLIGAYVEGINFRRGFDNSVLMKWATFNQGRKWRHRRKLDDKGRKQLFNLMEDILNELYEAPNKYNIEMPEGPNKTQEMLNRCLDHNFQTLEKEAEWFHKIYKPVTILPPDQYYSLVLQVTEGCSHNKCTFCDFYRDRTFKIKSPDGVKEHINDVNQFFGRSLGLRQSVFLADANALIIRQERLVQMLKIINKEYLIIADDSKSREIARLRREGHPVFGGIYSFIDLFTGEYKSKEQFREMRKYGVKRAYIGMESGSRQLLEFLNKPGSKEEIISAVNKIKAGGMHAGVIILIGAGGKEYQGTHITDTIEALNAMQLDEDDFIYFSEFYPQEGTPYKSVAGEKDVTPLNKNEIEEQRESIKSGLRYLGTDNSPKITDYDIREFMY